MSRSGEWTTIAAGARGFVALPAGAPPWPALLIIHSVMGIDDYIEKVTESFAAEGYYALTPDLYADDPGFKQHRQEHIEIAAHMGVDPERQRGVLARYPVDTQDAVRKAREWISGRPANTYINIVRGVFEHLRMRPDIREIGALGFCMGGRLIGELAATGAALSAGVIHYGGPPRRELVPNITAALEGHYAASDTAITNKIPDFAAAMTAGGKDFTYYVYDADHGFTLAAERFPEAKRIAMTRSRAFLARHLRPVPLAGAAE